MAAVGECSQLDTHDKDHTKGKGVVSGGNVGRVSGISRRQAGSDGHKLVPFEFLFPRFQRPSANPGGQAFASRPTQKSPGLDGSTFELAGGDLLDRVPIEKGQESECGVVLLGVNVETSNRFSALVEAEPGPSGVPKPKVYSDRLEDLIVAGPGTMKKRRERSGDCVS